MTIQADKKIQAEIARAYLKSKNVYRYRMKKIADMSDDEIVDKCHWWYEENNMLDDYLIFESDYYEKTACIHKRSSV